MISVISLFIPSLLAVYLRGKIIKEYGNKIKIVLSYILTVVILNLVMLFILRYVFDSRGNLILKLIQYSHYAAKYFSLSAVLASFEVCIEWFIRKKYGKNVIRGGELKKAILDGGKSKNIFEKIESIIWNACEKIRLEIKYAINKFGRGDWNIFKAVFIIAVLAHALVLTNNLANYDSVFFFHSDQDIVTSGRWFLKYAGGISSFFHLQWINGVLSLIYISIAAVVVVKLLEIKNPLLGVLAGIALATYPSVAKTFNFMYAADAYFLAMLLAVIAAWLMCMHKWRYRLSGGFLLGLSMGIYQAYLSVTLILLLLWIVKHSLIKGERIEKHIGGMIGGGAFAIIVYLIGLEYRIQGAELSSYQGIAESTLLHSFDWYLHHFAQSFSDIRLNFNTDAYESGYARIALVAVWAVTLAAVLCRMFSLLKKKGVICVLYGGIAIILMPIAVYCLNILSDGVRYYSLMLESIAFIWILPIVFCDAGICFGKGSKWCGIMSVILTGCLIVNLWNWIVVDNISYLASSIAYEKSYALSERIVDRIEQTEGYEHMKYIYLYGNIENLKEYKDARFNNKSVNESGIIPYGNKTYTYFINIYIGGNYKVLNNSDAADEIKESPEFQAMPAWPANGCTQLIGEVMVVKLGELK